MILVKFYKDVENKEGLPDMWPAEMRESINAQAGWTSFTKEEYAKHIEKYLPEYVAWKYQTKEKQDKILEIKNAAGQKILDKYPYYKQLNINELQGYTQADKDSMWQFINQCRKEAEEAISVLE